MGAFLHLASVEVRPGGGGHPVCIKQEAGGQGAFLGPFQLK
jgi:hypothetical protein